MERLWAGVAVVSRVAAWAGAAMLLFAALVVTAEILLRKVVSPIFGASYSFTGSDEIAGYLFAVATSWSMAHVLVTRGHVRIDALYGLLGPRLRAVCDVAALLALGLFVAVLLERTGALWLVAWEDGARSNTTLRVPLAWPQGAWVAGIALFAFALALALARTLGAVLRNDLALAAELAGASSQDDEIRQELESLPIAHPPARGA